LHSPQVHTLFFSCFLKSGGPHVVTKEKIGRDAKVHGLYVCLVTKLLGHAMMVTPRIEQKGLPLYILGNMYYILHEIKRKETEQNIG